MVAMDAKQPDLTRDKLLRAAFGEIHRQGFQAASIANILADTGFTKGALYHHFPTKQALGLAVIEEVIYGYLDGLIFKALGESDRPVETLLEIISISGAQTDRESICLGCPLNNLMQEMSPLDEAFKDCLNAILINWKGAVEQALLRGKEQRVIRSDVDCGAAALFVVSAWEGCVGTAKNLQSAEAYGLCMLQLHGFVSSLMI
ncbi:MAG: TetR/AcrR family transcriptional regulator [Sulfurimicrobium sp.]|jgi:AcrR family transcriptional regulator|nr:TetR/AcrR family transcriptional regulator [Sulfurimicrobium sp.]